MRKGNEWRRKKWGSRAMKENESKDSLKDYIRRGR